MKYPLGLFLKPPALPVDIYYIKKQSVKRKINLEISEKGRMLAAMDDLFFAEVFKHKLTIDIT